MIFDKFGRLSGFDECPVHSFNKNAIVKQYSKDLTDKNIVLLGDSLYVT